MRSLLLWGALIALVAFLVGFWNFAETVRQDVEEPAPAQAIVALTGGSLERLTTGVRLLEERKGERLLISGVNRIVTDAELLHALNADAALGACCIDVGRSAEDTLGNASETAAWAREHRYTNIILVTDDYHMPRSRAELEAALPEAQAAVIVSTFAIAAQKRSFLWSIAAVAGLAAIIFAIYVYLRV